MAVWPTSLPQAPEPRGYSNVARDNVHHTAMSYGQGKKRPKGTVTIRDVTMQFFLGNTEADILDDFYVLTLNRVEPFTWIDHRTGDTATYRFLAPPTVVPYGSALYWDVILKLELIDLTPTPIDNIIVDTLGGEILVDSLNGDFIIES